MAHASLNRSYCRLPLGCLTGGTDCRLRGGVPSRRRDKGTHPRLFTTAFGQLPGPRQRKRGCKLRTVALGGEVAESSPAEPKAAARESASMMQCLTDTAGKYGEAVPSSPPASQPGRQKALSVRGPCVFWSRSRAGGRAPRREGGFLRLLWML